MEVQIEKLDNERTVAKWAPIMDALKVVDKDMRRSLSIYAEYFSLNQNSDEIYSFNILPLNLKILSKLNLVGKKLEIKKGLEEHTYGLSISNKEMEDIKNAQGLDVIQVLENRIVDAITSHINKQLETKNMIYIDKAVQTFSLLKADDMPAKMYIKSNYEVV